MIRFLSPEQYINKTIYKYKEKGENGYLLPTLWKDAGITI